MKRLLIAWCASPLVIDYRSNILGELDARHRSLGSSLGIASELHDDRLQTAGPVDHGDCKADLRRWPFLDGLIRGRIWLYAGRQRLCGVKVKDFGAECQLQLCRLM